jgi:hypothetical protein
VEKQERKVTTWDTGISGRILLKLIRWKSWIQEAQKRVGWRALGNTTLYNLEPYKSDEFLDQLRDYQFLKRNFATVRQKYIEMFPLCRNFSTCPFVMMTDRGERQSCNWVLK